MKVITVRNVPDDVHEALVKLARQNRRSLQQQILSLLERVRILSTESPTTRAMNLREQLRGRDLGNTVAEIREDRGR
jgi:plasmid stability protein